MARIVAASALLDLQLRVKFDDRVVRLFDGPQLLGRSVLTAPLYEPAYFAQAAVHTYGQGLYWSSDFDMCPDWLRHHAPAVAEELARLPKEGLTARK